MTETTIDIRQGDDVEILTTCGKHFVYRPMRIGSKHHYWEREGFLHEVETDNGLKPVCVLKTRIHILRCIDDRMQPITDMYIIAKRTPLTAPSSHNWH